MKSIMSKVAALCIASFALFSFSSKPGGEGYEILLNNKVMIQKFGNDINAVQSLALNQQTVNGLLTIKYHHCGKVGKNRVITLKDAQDKILKIFKYDDVATPVSAMAINVKEIINLKKGSVKLYYSSSELPKERLLTTILLAV